MARYERVDLTEHQKKMVRQVASREEPTDLTVSVGASGDLSVTLTAGGTRSGVTIHVPAEET